MSELKKLLFFEFDPEIKKTPSKNALSIKHIKNLSVQNGIIEPYCKVDNFFKTYLTETEYENYLLYCAGLESTVLRLIPYQYPDDETGELKLRIFFVDNQKCLNEYIPATHTAVCFEQYLANEPFVVCKGNNLYIFDGTKTVYIIRKNANLSWFANSLQISYVKFYKDLTYFLVVGNNSTIYISAKSDFADIAKGELPTETLVIDTNYGKFQDIMICDNYIFIIQDYAIAKIQKTKDETTFTYFKTHTKIISGTARSINNYIVFCSTAGIFRFDGDNIVSLFDTLFDRLSPTGVAVTFNNKYYLASQIKNGEIFEDALLEMDIANKTINIMEFGKVVELYCNEHFDKYVMQIVLDGLNSHDTMVLSTKNNSDYASTKQVEFNKLFLDSNDNKSIQKIQVVGEGKFVFEVKSSTGDKFSYSASGSFTANNVCLNGHYFNVNIYGSSSFKIESVYIEYLAVENA